jgi:hypothetical protein
VLGEELRKAREVTRKRLLEWVAPDITAGPKRPVDGLYQRAYPRDL